MTIYKPNKAIDMPSIFKAEINKIVGLHTNMVRECIEIGRILQYIKSETPRGHFKKIVEVECHLSMANAENFMRVAEVFGDKIAIIANLKITALEELARKSVPESVRETILEKCQSTQLTVDEIKQEIRAARAEAKEDKNKCQSSRSTSKAPNTLVDEFIGQLSHLGLAKDLIADLLVPLSGLSVKTVLAAIKAT